MTSKFIIAVDTREQRPYTFKNIKPPPEVVVQTLQTGDYSIAGFESVICVERKELGDLFSSVGTGRTRFEREMIRMSKMDYAALIIESSLSGIFVNPPSRSKMNPRAVFRTLLSWSIKYNVHVWPAWSREAGEKITYILLKNFYNFRAGPKAHTIT